MGGRAAVRSYTPGTARSFSQYLSGSLGGGSYSRHFGFTVNGTDKIPIDIDFIFQKKANKNNINKYVQNIRSFMEEKIQGMGQQLLGGGRGKVQFNRVVRGGLAERVSDRGRGSEPVITPRQQERQGQRPEVGACGYDGLRF